MKTRSLILGVILILVVLIFIGSCATGKKAYMAKEDEELYGTWVNNKYNADTTGMEGTNPAKIIYKPNGTIEFYNNVTDVKYPWTSTYTITDSWADAEGNIWYKFTWKHPAFEVINYELCKISDTGRVYEKTFYNIDYPTEIDPNSYRYTYWIYYRQ